MMRLVAALLLLCAGPSSAETVFFDRGGPILERSARVGDLIASNERIRILGYCASACTMFLASPRVCVVPGAVLVFHGPSYSGDPMPRIEYDRYVDLIASHYPPDLAHWFRAVGHVGDNYVAGQVLIDLGVTQC